MDVDYNNNESQLQCSTCCFPLRGTGVGGATVSLRNQRGSSSVKKTREDYERHERERLEEVRRMLGPPDKRLVQTRGASLLRRSVEDHTMGLTNCR